MNSKRRKIHVVVNPASGKDEPVLNTLNQVWRDYDIDWDVSVTHAFGDATRQAREAAERGVDLVVGYGGDGTQHEIVNAVMGLDQLIGILPGGTGNGFGTGLGIPHSLRQAAEVIATSSERLAVDVMLLGDDKFCLSRLYTGIEEDQQTSREMKDKYGVLAYGVSLLEGKEDQAPPAQYRLTIDGEVIEEQGLKCYVVNSASTGMNVKIGNFDVTDGWLDVFMLDKSKEKLGGAIDRFLRWETPNARSNYWRGREIVLDAEPSQPVWADGEFYGRTPVTIKVLPGALTVVVPESSPKGRR